MEGSSGRFCGISFVCQLCRCSIIAWESVRLPHRPLRNIRCAPAHAAKALSLVTLDSEGVMKFAIGIIAFVLLTISSQVQGGDITDWPPIDPKQYVTKVDFTESWAKRLDGFQTLQDLQRSAGTKGTISAWALDNPKPHVSYHWRSQPKNGRIGYMLATVYKDGGIGVGIMTDEHIEVVANNFGAFVCDRCNPPITIRSDCCAPTRSSPHRGWF